MQLVFATHNRNKVREVQRLTPSAIQFRSLRDIGCEEDIPETMSTIEANAVQKAEYVYTKYGENCFAEDTGLEIQALDNEPGVYTARYAGKDRDDQANMDLVLQRLKGVENRRARFRTVFALIIDGKTYTFEGIAEGEILQERRGQEGFGYDPIFKPLGQELSFAEMEPSQKNTLSHRAKAFEALRNFLLTFNY